MRSYVDEHVQVIGKRFWERQKKKILELHFTKFPFVNTVDSLPKYTLIAY